jgi:class 3 adenylate cyclase
MTHGREFQSLEDYLASTMSDIDGVLDDGWGASFPVKGRELEATILFADITSFSTRTLELTPAQTLAYVQNFFAWITAEALRNRPGIVDKYIGDEVMVVFSTQFGSVDPFTDAVQAAAAMSRHDALGYNPHIGIASGPVIVGYAGTAFRYNVSAFGAPVALAARCAGVKPADPDARVSSTIVMPSAEWGDRDLDAVVPPVGNEVDMPRFRLLDARETPMKGLGDVEVREIHNVAMWWPSQPAEERAVASIQFLQDHGRYWPRGTGTNTTETESE